MGLKLKLGLALASPSAGGVSDATPKDVVALTAMVTSATGAPYTDAWSVPLSGAFADRPHDFTLTAAGLAATQSEWDTARLQLDWAYTDAGHDLVQAQLAEVAFEYTAAADTTAPSGTILTSATPGDGEVVLVWQAASDNVAVTGYQYRIDGGAPVDVGDVLTFTVTGLTNGTAYGFEVRAYDAVPNFGTWSGSISATPTVPGNDIVTTNLLRDYRFDEGVGNPIDRAAGETMTLSGATWTSAGVLFDGVDDVGVMPTDLVNLDLVGFPTGAMGVLFRAVSYPGTVANVVNLASVMEIGFQGGTFRPTFGARTDADTASLTLTAGADNILLDTWYYLFLDYDGATLRAYINGTERGSRAKTGSFAASGSAPRLAADENGANFANIEVAAFHIYWQNVPAQTVVDNWAVLQDLLTARGE